MDIMRCDRVMRIAKGLSDVQVERAWLWLYISRPFYRTCTEKYLILLKVENYP